MLNGEGVVDKTLYLCDNFNGVNYTDSEFLGLPLQPAALLIKKARPKKSVKVRRYFFALHRSKRLSYLPTKFSESFCLLYDSD
jgi:hypothetical protein